MNNQDSAHSIKMSAIVPNYNSAEFLPRSLQSLLNQTESFTEIIIIDDGSTDDSLTVIRSYMNEFPIIRLIQHDTNQGVCAALNSGIAQTIGDYIILCAADDWYHQEIVSLSKKIIKQFPSVGLVCGEAMLSRYDAVAFRRMLVYPTERLITPIELKKLANKGYVDFNGSGGMFMRREAVLKAGMLYPQLRWHSDWLLYFLVALQYGFYYTRSIFVYIDLRKESYSENKKNWKIQKQVMIDLIEILKVYHTYLWKDFKKASLLPHYSIRCIPLFLSDTRLRGFVSLRLLWRFLINNKIVVSLGRLLPYPLMMKVKKLLKA